MTEQTFALTVHAAGEVRDAEGNLLNADVALDPTQTAVELAGVTYHADEHGQIQVPVEALAAFPDDQLRAAGLDEPTITQIRSTT